MNLWDILILGAIGVALITAFRVLRAKGRSGGCGCGCAGCTKGCAEKREEDHGKNCCGG